MKRSLLLLIPALFATLIYSCKKDDGEHNTVTPGKYRSLDEAIQSTAPVAKSTAFGVSSGDTLYAPGGTRFVIPPNVFETLNGTKVTGSVDITIQDWLKKGDMVFGRVLPLTYGVPLLSGGQAFIQIKQGTQILRIRPDTFITVMFPQFGATSSGLTGWVGRTQAGSANTVNWLAADPTLLLPNTDIPDTISVRADTLHYIQVATALGAGSPGNSFTVLIDTSLILEQSMAVVMYDGVKAVYPLPSANNGQINAVNVPSLAGIHIAVMGINKGQFFGGIAEVQNPQSDSTYKVKIKAMEPPTLKLQMNAY